MALSSMVTAGVVFASVAAHAATVTYTGGGTDSDPNGRKAKLALSADGKTLELVVPGMGGMILIFR